MNKVFGIGFLLLIILTINNSLIAQKVVKKEQFDPIPPLDFPCYLSGTFGELRSNHFHSGIDIKTQGVEGKKVFAVEDGYISRIKVSLWGYGKALYITHPEGYVSVYGHLKRFNDSIESYVRKEQYKRKSYEIEIFPKKNELKVRKGEVIAYSGNTGGSAGPHLHFEIRKASNQHPINPLLFQDIKIKDVTRPKIKKIAIYPFNDSSVINDVNDTVFFDVYGWGEKHYLKDNPEIKIHGKISFGLKSYDLMDGTNNKNGIYCEKVFIDSSLVFAIKMDELSFSTTRYINSLIDYRTYKNKNERLIETKLDTNNKLDIYELVKNNGIFTFDDTLKHKITFVVEDAYGNEGKLEFTVKGYQPDSIIRHKKVFNCDTTFFVAFNKKFSFQNNGMKISIPANALYHSSNLSFGIDTSENDFLSKVYCIGNTDVPVQKWMSVYIKPDTILSDSLKDKYFIASVDKRGKGWYSGGHFENDFLKIKTRSFGKYAVMIDTVKPEIKPLNISNNIDISKRKYLKFIIKDTLSGIKKYAAFLNGKWILMEYEPKKNLIFYKIDDIMKKGDNNLKLYVFDNRDNRAVFEAVLKY